MPKLNVPRAGKWIVGIIAGLIVAAVAGLAGLIIFGTAKQPPELASVSNPMRHIDFANLILSYRLYPGTGPDVVLLIHGSSGESSGMHAVAEAMNATGATIVVPDLRGHGHDGRAGDIDYIGQLDDDLADIVDVVRSQHPNAGLMLVGHSSGGGFVFRISEGRYASLFNRLVLLSPTMPYGAVTFRPSVGGWAAPYIGRIIALTLLNKVGVRWFNGMTVIAFAVARTASVPLIATYSYRMVANFGARTDAIAQLATVTQPLSILIGDSDELFYADRYGPLIHGVRPDVPVTLVAGVDHMGMVTDPRGLAAEVDAIR